MNAKDLISIAGSLTIIWSVNLFAAAPGPVKRYQGVGDLPGQPNGRIVPIPAGGGFEMRASGPAPIQPSWSGSHYVGRLGDRGDFQWGLTTYGLKSGGLEMRAHPTEPWVFAKLEGLVDEEFWTVFGFFDGRTGTRRFERGFRAIVNKTDQSTFIPHPFSKLTFLPSGRIAFVVDDHGDSIKAAVLGDTGHPVWQKVFVSPLFKETTSQTMNATLVEGSKMSCWAVLNGNPLSTGGQTPPTLQLVRLDAEGRVSGKTKTTGFPSPTTVDLTTPNPAGGLLLFRVVHQSHPPTPTSIPKLTANLASFDPDGRLLWARAFPEVSSDQAAVWSPDNTSLFLVLAKLISSTPLQVDQWLLKLDAKSGAILRSVKVGNTGLTTLKIIGVSEQRVFLLGYESGTALSAFIGHTDADLKNPVWRKFARGDLRNSPTATYAAAAGRLFISSPMKDAGWVDLITLNGNLGVESLVSPNSRAAPCEMFVDATLALSDNPLPSESLALSQAESDLEVRDTMIDLVPSARLELKPFLMKVEDTCQPAATGLPKKPEIRIKPNASGGGFSLSFPTQSGIHYEILHSASLDRAFFPMATLAGDGELTEFPVAPTAHFGFYVVRANPF